MIDFQVDEMTGSPVVLTLDGTCKLILSRQIIEWLSEAMVYNRAHYVEINLRDDSRPGAKSTMYRARPNERNIFFTLPETPTPTKEGE